MSYRQDPTHSDTRSGSTASSSDQASSTSRSRTPTHPLPLPSSQQASSDSNPPPITRKVTMLPSDPAFNTPPSSGMGIGMGHPGSGMGQRKQVRQSSRSGAAGSGAARRRESSGPGLVLSGPSVVRPDPVSMNARLNSITSSLHQQHLAAPSFLTRPISPSSTPRSVSSPSTNSSTSPLGSPQIVNANASSQALPIHSPGIGPVAPVAPVPVRGVHFLSPAGQGGYIGGVPGGAERARSRSPSPAPESRRMDGEVPSRAVLMGSDQVNGDRKSGKSTSASSIVSGNTSMESPFSTPGKASRVPSHGSGSKFSSPPPPLPPPADMTLPPLPPIPSIASKSSIGSAGSSDTARRIRQADEFRARERDRTQAEALPLPSADAQQRMRKGSLPLLSGDREHGRQALGPSWTPLATARNGPGSSEPRARNSMFETLGTGANAPLPVQRGASYETSRPNGNAPQRTSYYDSASQATDREARDILYGDGDVGRMPKPKSSTPVNGSRDAGQVVGLGLGPVERTRQVSAPVTQQGQINRTSAHDDVTGGRSRSVSAAVQSGLNSNRSSMSPPVPSHRPSPPPQAYQQTFRGADSPEAQSSPTFSASSSNSRGSPVPGRASSELGRGLVRPKSRLGQDGGRVSSQEDRSPDMSSSYKSGESSGSPSLGRGFFGRKKNESPKPATDDAGGGSWSKRSKGKLSMPPMSGPSRVEKLPRRSEDLLGGREPWEDFAELPAPGQTAGVNGLGLGHPSAPAARPALQPRKSSGGLRALFGLGKKDKDKEKDKEKEKESEAFNKATFLAPEPIYSAPTQPRRRASEDLLRTRARTLQEDDNEAVLLVPSPDPNILARRSFGQRDNYLAPDLPAFDSQLARHSVYQPAPMDAAYEEDGDNSGEEGIPRSASLHLLDLPQMDLSMGSTFDIFSKTLESPKRSPNRKSLAVADVKGARRRSRSFSEFSRSHSSGLTVEPSTTASQKLMAITAQEPPMAIPAPPALGHASHDSMQSSTDHSLGTMPAPALSDHGRTFSGTSNSVTDSSPPRTPGSNESHLGVATSGSWDNVSLPPSHSGEIASLGKAWVSSPLTQELRTSRLSKPRLLQLSETQDRPRTIVEQTESPITPTAPEIKLVPSTLAPAADITAAKAEQEGPAKPFSQGRDVMTRSVAIGARFVAVTSSMNSVHLAREMRRILQTFRSSAQGKVDRAGLIRLQLLDHLAEGEKRQIHAEEQEGNAAIRGICADWIECLLGELGKDQAANERGACLEAISAIIESQWLSTQALKGFPTAQWMFRNVMVRIMTYVLDKLSGKGVFHNTLLFSGRVLAFAFFRIEGVAHQLLAALPIKNSVLSRFAHGALQQVANGDAAADPAIVFPHHLGGLHFDTAKAYADRLGLSKPSYQDGPEADAFLFKAGNWLRRWQSDDSELFPAFYKAYHRQLATYLGPAVERHEGMLNQPVPVRVLFDAPGYAHLAAIFSAKTHGYILGAINAVTTTSAVSTFNADETAGSKGNVKPPALETANRRLTETILALTTSRSLLHSAQLGVIECNGTTLWGGMVDVWIKSLITKTSLFAPKGVFCLLDLLDGIVFGPVYPPVTEQRLPAPIPFLDVPYIISIMRIVLTQTDHHLTLAKSIAFVWTHYEALCARVEDREELCIKLLLDPAIFERLMLFWSQSVRSYVLRLVVFRLGHIFTNPSDVVNHEMEVATVQLLNARLECIRRRHDELEPKEEKFAAMMVERAEDGSLPSHGIPRSKSTITMIPAEHSPDPPVRAERLLATAADPQVQTGVSPAGRPEALNGKAQEKSANWFKRSFSKQKKGKVMKVDGGVETEISCDRAMVGSPPSSIGANLASGPSAIASKPKAAVEEGEQFKSHSPNSDDSFEGHVSALQPRAFVMPVISHTAPSGPGKTPGTPPPREKSSLSPTQFAFAFELPTASPRSDTFDKRPIPHSPRSSLPGTTPPRLPPSPHMSRSFSRRSSLLHPTAASIADGPASPSFRRSLATVPELAGYDRRLHPYCIRMLAELEDVQKEYEEWWADDGPGRMDNAPPRLNVAWPFSDEED